jgi:hypothetical protein
MSQYTEASVHEFAANAAIGQFLRVYVGTNGKVAVAGVNDFGVGTAENPATAADERVGVRVNSAVGSRKCVASGVIAVGDPVFCGASGKVSSSGAVRYGVALEAATADNDVIEVLVSGDTGGVLHLRSRFTIAEVNAGATVLPAIPGRAYRLCDLSLIAVGGNVGAATGILVRGTQSASVVSLMDAKTAGLTRSTLLRIGTATNGLVLADGASFVANDANTAITIIKDGSDITTATHIDVLISFVVDA